MNFFIIILSIIFLISVFLIVAGVLMMTSKYSTDDIRFWWRLLMIVTGIVIAIEASEAFIHRDTFFDFDTIPFTLRLIMEWFFIAQLVSMIIVAGLRYSLKRWQMIVFPSLLVISMVVAICFDVFSGVYTPLHTWRDIISNFTQMDVRVKVYLFVLSVLCTFYMIFVPIVKELRNKKLVLTKWFYIYAFFAFLQPLTYIFYALGSPVSGIILGIGCLSFVVIFTVAFMRNENPLIHSKDAPKIDLFSGKSDDPIILKKPDCESVDNIPDFINDNYLYLNKLLTAEELSQISSIPLSDIITFYKNKGYSNFSDFVSSFRLAHFKRLVITNPRVPIAALASDSGFPSRSGFYRYFQTIEGISPTEYRNNLK